MRPVSIFQVNSPMGPCLESEIPTRLTAPHSSGPREFLANTTGEGIRNHMLPGVRCQTCAANGQEVWVIPGRACGYCRTPAPPQ